jgi:predicted DsbA family dithiol-disulfide isomerase
MSSIHRVLCFTALSLGFVGLVACSQPAATAGSPGGSSASAASSSVIGSISGVVARINGQDLTADQLDAEIQGQLIGLKVQAHDARTKGLEKLIDDQLLEAEATKRGVSTDELVKAEVADKLAEVSDEDAKAYFDSKVPKNSKADFDTGPRPVKGRIKQILRREQETALRTSFIGSLRESAGVEILLQPMRFDVGYSDVNPRKGDPATAAVTIIQFSEFQCPYCSKVLPTMDKIQETYGDKVAIVFRDYPLPMHKEAPKASQAGHCANEQGKFWDMHDLLFQNQRALQIDKLRGYATQIGLDQAKFDECLDSDRHAATVEADTKAGAAVGVRGTPAFFVNGQFLNGAQPFENFQKLIDAELKAKGLL